MPVVSARPRCILFKQRVDKSTKRSWHALDGPGELHAPDFGIAVLDLLQRRHEQLLEGTLSMDADTPLVFFGESQHSVAARGERLPDGIDVKAG